jgi:sulfate adenylyltransferase subunit 1 (EFTu-like GTPase family)
LSFSERFNEIQVEYDAFVSQLGDRRPENILFVPISALNGDNVVNPSAIRLGTRSNLDEHS